jgi:2-dehydro-3-deoxygalactonokinase
MVTDFKTYMTGEVFEVLSRHTILKESLLKSDLNDQVIAAFLEGVKQSEQKRFLNELFQLRAKDLFGQKSKTENYFFLSGLLIGQELCSLVHRLKKEIKIGATGDLASLYLLATEQLNLSASIIAEDVMKRAVITGHQQLISQIIDF